MERKTSKDTNEIAKGISDEVAVKSEGRSTPTPWKEMEIKPLGDGKFLYIVTTHDDESFAFSGMKRFIEYLFETYPEFIVRAVNEYDELKRKIAFYENGTHTLAQVTFDDELRDNHAVLLKAAKAALITFEDDDLYERSSEVRKTLKKAIAQAEGK